MNTRILSMKNLSVLVCALAFVVCGARAAAPGENGRIAFQAATMSGTQIAVVGHDGTGLRILTSGADATAPAWKPASSSIAFAADGVLSSVDLVTGDVTALVAASGYVLSSPAWSPDGSKLAFIGTKASDGSIDLWVVNTDGTGLANVTNDAAVDAEPAWSSDGATILFATDRDANFEIYSIHPDGTGAVRLTDDPASDRDPDMAPDGSSIVFVRTVFDVSPALWTMSADGTGAVPLTDASFPAVSPAWSPDGTLIAFAGAPDAGFDIWTIAPDASGLKLIAGGTDDQTAPTWQTIVAGDNRPPTADAGADATLECTSFAGAIAELDGAASTDPDSTTSVNDIVLYEWFEGFGQADETLLGTGSALDVPVALGEHTVTLQVTDSVGQTATATIVIVVQDTIPPVIELSVTPAVIWPANHKLVTVRATATANDVCSPQIAITLVSVTSNEPDNGTGAGDTANDVQNAVIGTADYVFSVRAERSGNGTGRVYTATYRATDPAANTVTASADIVVPHDRATGRGDGKAGGRKKQR